MSEKVKLPIYLDYHSTTPVDPLVLEQMLPYFKEEFGNASSKSHCFGWRAEFAVEKARTQVAKAIGAESSEIVFTSGATESNNAVLIGIAEKYGHLGKHIITSSIEHKCILEAANYLSRKGFDITLLPVNKEGQVEIEEVRKAIRPDTILISVMMANNETGTIQPFKEIGALAKEKNILFHTDAAQAVGKIRINVKEDNIDLLSMSAHKLCGPKGVGALFVRRREPRVVLEPLMHGGGQERGFRSGTLNVPGIVGLGKACEIATEKMDAEISRLSYLRDYLLSELRKELGEVTLNGHPTDRLPQSLNISFPHVASDALVARLKSIAISSTSACMSAASVPSYVLAAMKLSDEVIHGSIRIGLGRFTTQDEVNYAILSIVKAVKEIQANSPTFQRTEARMEQK
ncbi:MAG: cysteine desulfurase [Oligoflexia bacterium]|nr:cysteine desulfurase [Oligoflexia bacterium]